MSAKPGGPPSTPPADAEIARIEAIYDQVRRAAPPSPELPAVPTPAVACVLWRRAGAEAADLEVYVARRAVTHPFLGGFWGFPGGRADPGDASPEATCAREVMEEIGVALPPDADAYRPIATFVTPDFAPLRFAARYFLVEAPAGAVPDPTVSRELERGEWTRPRRALERHLSGEWLLSTPVVLTLAALARGLGDQGELEAALEAASRADVAARAWPLAAGIMVAPFRTPTLPPAIHTNAYIVGARDLVVVDPGSPYDDEQSALDRELDQRTARGARLTAILLTHHHGDHVGGVAHLTARTGAPVWAHSETARRLTGQVTVARALMDGEVIELDGDSDRPRRLRAVFTPGHAPGHLCFLEETTGFMLCGDMVASIGTILIDPSEGDMRQYLDSLARIAELAPRALLPAHGAPIADPPGKLAEYRSHRLWREERVAAALSARGRSRAHDLVGTAYSDVPPMLFGLAERSLVSHLVKLAGDGRARRVGDEWEPAGE